MQNPNKDTTKRLLIHNTYSMWRQLPFYLASGLKLFPFGNDVESRRSYNDEPTEVPALHKL